MNSTSFTVSTSTKQATPWAHHWEECVGSGHAALTVRADWRAHLSRCRSELGVKRTRFHGLLDDDFDISLGEGQDDYVNLDEMVDFHLSIGMEPLFEVRRRRAGRPCFVLATRARSTKGVGGFATLAANPTQPQPPAGNGVHSTPTPAGNALDPFCCSPSLLRTAPPRPAHAPTRSELVRWALDPFAHRPSLRTRSVHTLRARSVGCAHLTRFAPKR